MSSTKRAKITPNPPRWKPNPDPASIVVPGLDTDASTTDQIEQIEQLITIKLQNIDENFSKIHNALANKLLPAVKRYAVGTEPVREAAKFWTSFYEQAAQIRIPTLDDDYQTVNEASSERDEEPSSSQEHTDDGQQDQTPRAIPSIYESSVVSSESSFMPGQGAFSSTPAMSRVAPGLEQDSAYTPSNSSDPSWTPSLESPMVRLNREINNLTMQEAEDSRYLPSTSAVHPHPAEEDSTIDSTFRQSPAPTPRQDKGKGKSKDPLLHNVLRHNLYTAADNSTFENKPMSPLKFRAKPKTPLIDKSRNPYLPPEETPSTWSGVVDLRSLSPKKYGHGSARSMKTLQTPQRDKDDDDDSFDALPPGMSPPLLMSPARPPRSAAELGLLKVGQTPARDASARITKDILRSVQRESGRAGGKGLFGTTPSNYYESSMSTAMSPPSLSKYRQRDYSMSSTTGSISKDTSLESMIRHIRNDIRPDVGATPGMATTPGLRIKPKVGGAFTAPGQIRQPALQPQPQRQQQAAPVTPDYPQHQHHLLDDDQIMHHQQGGHDSLDSDSDSLDIDELRAAENPGFLVAPPRAHRGVLTDDSFGSNGGSDDDSNDSLLAEEAADALIAPIHPFAGRGVMLDAEDDGFGDEDSDSFDGFEPGAPGFTTSDDGGFTETVFGVAPAQRAQMQAQQYGGNNGGLRLHGHDLIDDTIGMSAQRAANGLVDESPTPANWRD